MNEGQTYVADHIIQTFTVELRSLNGVGLQDLKDLIQQKWEVTEIEQSDGEVIGYPGCPDF